MEVRKTAIEGVLVLKPKVFEDHRGYFFESYNERIIHEAGIVNRFVQDNQSKSSYGVVRGLHMQKEPHSQAKLVRVLEGAVYDVAVDLRPGSPSYLKWFGIELSAENRFQMFVPKGCYHGFSVLSKTATVFYKCDEFYYPGSESGIRFNDPQLNINWKVPVGHIKISDKDKNLPYIEDLEKVNNG